MVGDRAVGKSNILLRYMNNKFDQNTQATLGVEFSSKYIRTADGNSVIRAQLWDTVGDERFKSVSNVYLRGAVGALLCFDVTNSLSFANLKGWLEQLRNVANQDIVILCVGNKTDLVDKRAVSKSEGEEFAMNNDIGYLETSALNGTNIDAAFLTIINRKF